MSIPECFEICIDHHVDELRKTYARLPTQAAMRLGGVANQQLHLGRAEEFLVDHNMLAVIETYPPKGELLPETLFPGRDQKFKITPDAIFGWRSTEADR